MKFDNYKVRYKQSDKYFFDGEYFYFRKEMQKVAVDRTELIYTDESEITFETEVVVKFRPITIEDPPSPFLHVLRVKMNELEDQHDSTAPLLKARSQTAIGRLIQYLDARKKSQPITEVDLNSINLRFENLSAAHTSYFMGHPILTYAPDSSKARWMVLAVGIVVCLSALSLHWLTLLFLTLFAPILLIYYRERIENHFRTVSFRKNFFLINTETKQITRELESLLKDKMPTPRDFFWWKIDSQSQVEMTNMINLIDLSYYFNHAEQCGNFYLEQRHFEHKQFFWRIYNVYYRDSLDRLRLISSHEKWEPLRKRSS